MSSVLGVPISSPSPPDCPSPLPSRAATTSFAAREKYRWVVPVIEKLCRGRSNPRILEFGGDDGEFQVTRVSTGELPPFDRESFDVVLALDTIDDIPAEEREAAMAAWLRFAQHGAIVSTRDRPLNSLLERLDLRFAEFAGIGAAEHEAAIALDDAATAHALDAALRDDILNRIVRGRSSPPFRRYYVIVKSFDASDALEVESPDAEPMADAVAAKRIAEAAVQSLTALAEQSRHEPAALREVVKEMTRGRSEYDLRHWVLLSFADALTQSASWRLLAPLRRLKNLIWPRGFTRRDLRPWKEIEPLPADGEFRATGADPQFVACCYLPAGWLRVRLTARVAHKSRLEIYAERDGAFDALSLLGQFTLSAGDNDEEFFLHLDRPTRALRIDPLDGPGDIHIERLDVAPRPGPYTIFDALRRKLRLLRAYRNTGPVLKKGLKLFVTGQWREVGQKWALGLNDPRCTRHGFYEPEKAYERWMAAHRLTDPDRVVHREWANSLADPPVISVLMPTYNTPEKYLRLAIESVLKQTYPHWELCIADDGSTDERVRTVLAEYTQRDSRIKLAPPGRRGGISAATNAALAAASGRFVALLDHDDELAEYALERMARAIVAQPDADMLYSDEDKLHPDGRRTTPFFKPDWSPEFFLGCMYTCHLGVYRTDLLREVGGFRSAYDGAQDYDLALRVSEKARRVVHVPDILYHWRLLPNSTATSVAAKPEAHAAAMRALKDHLRRTDRPGRVDVGPSAGLSFTRYKVRGTPRVSIIIPSQCRAEAAPGRAVSHIENCVTSIAKRSTWANHEIIILDRDTMSEAMQRKLLGDKVRRVSYRQPFNWSMVNNLGARQARGEYLLFLNDDMEVGAPGWMEALLEFAQQPEIGAVGAKLTFPDGSLQHVGVAVLDGKPGHPFYGHPRDHAGYHSRNLLPHNCAAVTGACLMTRAEVFREAGGFDEGLPLNYNDIDYCFRVRDLGYRVVYTPHAELIHFEGSSKPGVLPGEMQAFRDRWGEHAGDPFYNVNLNMETFDYRIGDPACQG